MRLRLTIVVLLAAGILARGAGTGLAYQGLGRSGDNAAVAQYGAGLGNQPDRILGDEVIQPDGLSVVEGLNQPERIIVVAPAVDDVQPARQVEAGSSLAVTGFAAIPVLLLGAALLLTGTTVRRSARREG